MLIFRGPHARPPRLLAGPGGARRLSGSRAAACGGSLRWGLWPRRWQAFGRPPALSAILPSLERISSIAPQRP
jgi:hypothetical protein